MKWTSILPLGLAALALFGCNGGDTADKGSSSSTTTTTTTTGGGSSGGGAQLKVALLTPGEVSDSGWNALAYNGLQAIKKELNADVSNKVSTDTNIKEDMRSYAQQGYTLVIGHGFEYNKPALEVAKDFPKTIFVTTSGEHTADNVGYMRYQLEQGFYLAGLMAGKMSKTGIVAEVGGIKNIPSIESTFKAFEAGARAANPKIQIKKVYADSFTDIAAAQKATETVISQGADFVIHQANNAAQGVFNAAKAKGIYAFGANADQNANDSGAVIASAVIVMDPSLLDMAKAVQAGTYKGTVKAYGMDTGSIDFVLNPKLKDKVPADVQKLIEDTKADIKSGKLAVPMDKF